ncbi:YkvA family protein [Flaviflagellibacter deserti]|uniref:YkvA family protein n=1 Tax=Flaviflagellibacter deserti TaxID=2267266 RepID=A0ABV9Z581_9HYPH
MARKRKDDELTRIEQEREVREGFWPKLQKFAANLPFAEQALSAYYCAFDRETPNSVRFTLIGALAYFVLPMDAIPDILPLLGFADDAGVLSAALVAVGSNIKESHRVAARASLERLRTGETA